MGDLGKALINAPSLRELLLSGNEIGPMGAQALANGWAWVRTLHYVDLSCNPLESHGVELIAVEIPYWQQVVFQISLTNVNCDDTGAKKIRSVLEAHPKN